MLWEQGVVGSNPTTPTKEKAPRANEGLLCFYTELKACFRAKVENPKAL